MRWLLCLSLFFFFFKESDISWSWVLISGMLFVIVVECQMILGLSPILSWLMSSHLLKNSPGILLQLFLPNSPERVCGKNNCFCCPGLLSAALLHPSCAFISLKMSRHLSIWPSPYAHLSELWLLCHAYFGFFLVK